MRTLKVLPHSLAAFLNYVCGNVGVGQDQVSGGIDTALQNM